jgi:hypothetical protein
MGSVSQHGPNAWGGGLHTPQSPQTTRQEGCASLDLKTIGFFHGTATKNQSRDNSRYNSESHTLTLGASQVTDKSVCAMEHDTCNIP